MTSSEWFVIKAILGGASGLAGFLVALFAAFGVGASPQAKSRLRARLQAKWHTIDRSRMIQVPDLVIRWILELCSSLVAQAPVLVRVRGRLSVAATVTVAGLVASVCWLALHGYMKPALILGGLSLLFFGLVGADVLIERKGEADDRVMLFRVLGGLLAVSALGYFALRATQFALALAPVQWLPFAFLALAYPVFYSALMLEVVVVILLGFAPGRWGQWMRSGEAEGYLLVFGVGVSFSFFVTATAFLVGHMSSPEDWIPRTLQMLLSNVLFDGLTLVATLYVLGLAVRPRARLPIPVAVTLDLLLAAVFACASLWFGLCGSDKAISIAGTMRVLVGQRPEGGTTHIGPLFWAMHTAFLPTAGYLTLILACWLGKAITVIVRTILRCGSAEEVNPFALGSAVCSVFFALFVGLSEGAGHFADAALRREAAIEKAALKSGGEAAEVATRPAGGEDAGGSQ